jgi:hypothetical protein
MLAHAVEWVEFRAVGTAQGKFHVRAYATDVGWIVFERPELEIRWTEVPTTDVHLIMIRDKTEGTNESNEI